jgi:hypothetical protein
MHEQQTCMTLLLEVCCKLPQVLRLWQPQTLALLLLLLLLPLLLLLIRYSLLEQQPVHIPQQHGTILPSRHQQPRQRM